MKRIFTLFVSLTFFSWVSQAQAPTTQANAIQLQPVTDTPTSLKINWTSGTGTNNVLVVIKNSTGVFSPNNGTSYAGNVSLDYTAGSNLPGATSKVVAVYNGVSSAGTVTVTNLPADLDYTIQIYEYNTTGTLYNKNTSQGNPLEFKVFSASGSNSWTAPSGIAGANIKAWGAGGGGGSSNNAGGSGGGGGGGGAYSSSAATGVSAVTALTNYRVVVGLGGKGAVANTVASTTGGTSWVAPQAAARATDSVTNVIIRAVGGVRNTNNNNATAAGGPTTNAIGVVTVAGGTGALSGTNNGGGGGSSAGVNLLGAGVTANAGAAQVGGAAPVGGGKGGNAQGNTSDGLPGEQPGGGGAGSSDDNGQSGGKGGDGLIILSYSRPTISTIVRLSPLTATATTSSVTYQVTFSEAVSAASVSADGSDFAITGTGSTGGSIAVGNITATQCDVTISGLSANGLLDLNINGAQDIVSVATGNLMAGYVGSEEQYTMSFAPTFVSAKTSSTTNIQVKFSSAVTVAQANGSGFTPSGGGFTISAATINADPTIVDLTVSTVLNSFTCSSCLAILAGAVSNSAGNNLAVPAQNVTDGIAPTAPDTPTSPAPGVGTTINAAEELAGVVIRVPLGTSGAVTGDLVRLLIGAGAGVNFTPDITAVLDATDVGTNFYKDLTIPTTKLGIDGTKLISARIEDTATPANVGADSPDLTLTLDVAPPTAVVGSPVISPVFAQANSSSTVTFAVTYSGGTTYNLLNANITLNLTPGTITATVNVTNGTTATPTVTLTNVTGNGTVGITIAANTSSDAAGNQNLASAASATFTVDNINPDTPGVPDLQPGSDLGLLNSDNLTSDNTPTFTVAATGTAVGLKLELLAGATVVNTIASALASNTPTSSAITPDGIYNFSARTTDLAGNSASSTSLAVTIETVAPTVTSITPGMSPTRGFIPMTGTITADASGLGDQIDGVGTSFTTELFVGAIILNATGTETTPIGEVKSIEDNTNLTLTAIATNDLPAGSNFSIHLYFTVTFNEEMQSSTITTADFDATLGGSATAPNANVRSIGTNTLTAVTKSLSYRVSVSAAGNGTWRLDKLATACSDIYGNSNSSTYLLGTAATIDNTPPAFSAVTPASNGFTSSSAVGYTLTETNSPLTSGTVTWTRTGGTADPNSPPGYIISLAGTELNSGTRTLAALTNGGTATTNMVEGGEYSVAITGTDAAGNVATTVTNTTITVDKTAPTLLTTGAVAASAGAPLVPGYWNSFNTSLDVVVPFDAVDDATLEGGTVQIQLANSSAPGTFNNINGASGLSTINNTQMTSGTKTVTITDIHLEATTGFVAGETIIIRAIVTDRAGIATIYNVSTDTFINDQTAPAVPTINLITDTGPSNSDDYTNDNTPDFDGNAEAGSTVTLLDGGTLRGTITAGGGGTWGPLTATDIGTGASTMTARATDAAGNFATSGNLSVTVDQTLPIDFTTGTTTTVVGNLVAGYWNGTNTSINVSVPIENEASVRNFGTIQLQMRKSTDADGLFANLGSAVTIGNTTPQLVNILEGVLEAHGAFLAGNTLVFRAIITDRAGNTKTGSNSSSTRTVDQNPPTVTAAAFFAGFDPANDTDFTLCTAINPNKTSNSEYVHLTISEPLNITNGTILPVLGSTGFGASTGVFDVDCETGSGDNRGATVYHENGTNYIVHLQTSSNNGTWTGGVGGTTFSFTAGGTIIKDLAGNEMATIPASPGISTVAAPPKLASSMVLDLNGAGNEIISFTVDQLLSGTSVAADGVTNGIFVDADGIGGGAAVLRPGTYSTTDNTVTVTSTANNQWSSVTTVSYTTGAVSTTRLNTSVAMLSFGPEQILLGPVTIDNATASSVWANEGDDVAVTFTANPGTLPLSGPPTVTIGGIAAIVTGGNPYTATITTNASLPPDNTVITFSIEALQTGRLTTVTKTIPASSVTYDRTPPAAPTTPVLLAADDTGTSTSDGYTMTNTGLDFSGTAENSSTVKLYINSILVGSTTADPGTGAWSITAVTTTGPLTDPLADGTYSVTATATDAAANLSTSSSTMTLNIDNTEPVVTSISISPLTTLNGWSTTNGTDTGNGKIVYFRVTFSEPVDNLNFSSGPAGNNLQPFASGSVSHDNGNFTGVTTTFPLSYIDVPVTLNSSGTGQIRADFEEKGTEQNRVGLGFAGASYTFTTSFTGTNYYSITSPEPTTSAANFLNTPAPTSTTINWNAATGATHYLVRLKRSSSSFTPVTFTNGVVGGAAGSDGQDWTDTDFTSDGTLASIVSTTSATFNGINSSTTYNVEIYPLAQSPSANSADNWNYRFASPLTGNTTTTTSPSGTVSLVSAISSFSSRTTALTGAVLPQLNSVVNFEFSIKDDGSNNAADDVPFAFTQLVIKEGSGSANIISNWTQAIESASLFDGTTTVVVNNAAVTTGPNTITFSGLNPATIGLVGDNQTKTYILRIALKTSLGGTLPNDIDGKNFEFLVNSTSFTQNSATSSTLSGTSSAESGDAANKVDVAASKLMFATAGTPGTATNPQSSIGVGILFSQTNGAGSTPNPQVYALDPNNNRDWDYETANGNSGTVSNTQNFTQTYSPSFVDGILSLASFKFDQGNNSTPTKIRVEGTGTPAVALIESTDVTAFISNLTTITAETAAASELASFSSLTNSLPANYNFDFRITDDVGGLTTTYANNDNLPTIIQTITITRDANNGVNDTGGPSNTDLTTFDDWTKVIGGAELSDDAPTPNVISGANVSITSNSIVFSIPVTSGMRTIADGGFKNFYLRIWLQNPVDVSVRDILDNSDFAFNINQSNVSIGSANTTSTLANSTTNTGDTRNAVIVSTSQLDFTTQWLANATQSYDASLDADAVTGGVQPVVIKARDANQNLDRDYVGALALTTVTPATYPLANHTGINFATGQATLTNLTITRFGNGLNGGSTRIIATSGAFTSDGATAFRGNTCIINYSATSRVIKDATFASNQPYASGNGYPQNILYKNYQNATFTANSDGIALERFVLQDGGGSIDADGTPTTVQSITLNLSNYQYLRSVAIYDGSTLITQKLVSGNVTGVVGITGDLTFTAPFTNALIAGDNGNNDFTVYVTFNQNGIIDNEVVEVRVNGITAAGVSSSLDPAYISTNFATLISAENENKIEVVAEKIDFTTIPPSASVNVSFTVVVNATDANPFNNLDKDYNGAVSFTGNGNTSGYTVANIPTGNFSAGVLNYPVDNTGTTSIDEGFYFTSGTTFTQLTINGGAASTSGASVDAGSISGTSLAPGIDVKTSFDSWLYFDPAFSYTQRINFVNLQETSTTNTSQLLGKIILKDGGSSFSTVVPDDDDAFTKIDNFKIHIANSAYIRKIGLWTTGGTQIGTDQVPDGNGEVTFAGLVTYFAPDNGSYEFYLRASFNQSITDLDQLVVQIRTVAHNSGSKFAEQFTPTPTTTYIGGVDGAGVYGDATPTSVIISGTPTLVNRLDVVAISLDFVTQPSRFAGLNQPIDGTTSGNTGVVRARDKFTNLDTEFNYSYSITAPGATVVPSATNFTAGILNLTGMQYSTVTSIAGNGKLEIIANSINSNSISSGNSIPCSTVDVIHVTATNDTFNGVIQSESLKGGTTNQTIFGISFSASHFTVNPEPDQPTLNSFAIQFVDKDGKAYPYTKGTAATIYKSFKLLRAVGNGTATLLAQGTDYNISEEQSNALIAQNPTAPPEWKDKVKFTLLNPAPLYQSNYRYYIRVDVDVNVSVGTAAITSVLVDNGYYATNGTNSNISTSAGSSQSTVVGITRKFASTKPPVLVSTSPATGTLNVDPALNTITLKFDVPVVSFDGVLKVYNRDTGAEAATFTITNGVGLYTSGQPLSDQVEPDLSFTAPPGFDFQPDVVYYVTIEKGVFSNTDVTQRKGISDEGFNLYGGISYNGTFYFKGSSLLAPNMTASDDTKYFYTPTTATFNMQFNRPGKVYYMVVHPSLKNGVPATAPTTVTNAQILDPSLYTTTDVIASGSTIINQQAPNFQYITINANLTSNIDYFVYAFAENDAQPVPVRTSSPYGAKSNTPSLNYKVGEPGPTLKIQKPSITLAVSNPRFEICPNSSVRMEEPIIISEVAGNSADFRNRDINGAGTVAGINAYTATISPAITSYTSGAVYFVTFTSANTGISTINLNALGVRDIRTPAGVALSGGEIISAEGYLLRYNGTYFELINQVQAVQSFNVLLPTGFQYDITKSPTITLNGADFKQTLPTGTTRIRYRSSTLLEVNFVNNGAASFDNIIISDLFIIASSIDIGGNITRFGGTGLQTIADDRVLAQITSSSASSISFTNSFDVANKPWQQIGGNPDAYKQIRDANPYKPITYIPDNFATSVKLIPQLPTGDYGASFFSGSGLTNDELTLFAVTADASFNITLTHTDQNGCATTTTEQYLVYNHTKANPELLKTTDTGVSFSIDGTKVGLIPGIPDPVTNVPGLPAQTLRLADLVNIDGLAGYQLIDLVADIPVRVTNLPNPQVLDYNSTAWKTLVNNIPRLKSSLRDDNLDQTFKSYNWEYSDLINQTKTSAAGVEYPYDPASRFARIVQSAGTGDGETFFEPGSLGVIEFTGVYQSTADFSVFIPFRQEVELFIPAVPVVEVSGQSSKAGATAIFCESGLPFTVIGYPLANSSDVTGFFTLRDSVNKTVIIVDPGFVDNGNGTATFNPTKTALKNGYKTIKIEYTFKQNASPAVGIGAFYIRVTPNPVANFITSTLCEDIDVLFTDTTLDPIPGDVTITEWSWDFGDASSVKNSDLIKNPKHVYVSTGLFSNVNLRVKTNYACASVSAKSVDLAIGGTPVLDFIFEGVSTADPIKFTNKSTVSAVVSDSFKQLDWTFGDGTTQVITSGFVTTSHNYALPKFYDVNLKVTSTIGCVNDSTQRIVVLSKVIPTATTPYSENFETANGMWQASPLPTRSYGINPSSWAVGAPTTSVIKINSATFGSKVVKTSLSGTYNPLERSAWYSPSFDISQLERPMVTFNSFTQMEISDGVVLQYSIDNKNVADPLKVWWTVGQQDEGVEWFSAQGITAKPGDQPDKDYGWSTIEKNKWVESKHALENVTGKDAIVKVSRVVFRFALASAKSSIVPDGFAFDNFRIGERTRTILLENFTTTDGKDAAQNATIKSENEFVSGFVKGGLGTTVVKLNYHVGFTGTDPFNLDNPADPSSRALYYNVKNVPYAFLDGGRAEDAIINPAFSSWGQKTYDTQTLQLGQADITVPTPTVAADGSIKFNVQVKALFNLPDSTVLHVAVIEQSIIASSLAQAKKDQIKTGETTLDYVLKKMLPNASGTKFGTALAKDQSRTFTGFEYYPDATKLYTNKDDLAIIVFLQNEYRKGMKQNIYQSELVIGILDPAVVTGLENAELLANMEVYPNPANNEFTIQLPGVAKQSMEIQLVDQVGKVVTKDSIKEGTSRKTINSQDLAAGIYILQIGSGKSGVVRKKILIVHQD